MYFAYGETELSYLRQKDKRLGAVIDRVGHVQRAVDTDLFSSVVHHIIGQQISTKAQAAAAGRARRGECRNDPCGRRSHAAVAGHDLP